jgi:phenylalanyl-tRNA synthetase beta chain
MRVPLSWLRDYVNVDLSPEELAERLTLLGMEVQTIERWGEDWRDVVVGELLAVEPHPRADRLSLTRVDVGERRALDIVCGATNIAVGQRVPVALPGAVLPGNRRIERTEKMGVASDGMLCSGDELHLTADADGILILPPDAPVGRPLAELYGDVVLDIDVKPNRGDVLSMVGLAREVAAATGATVRWPDTEPPETGDDVARHLAVAVADPDLCPRFVGRWVDGVTIAPSPDRIQMRLLAAGQRPISNVVDASNYVMLELGKPIHTFDADAVATDPVGRRSLVVRRAVAGERLETLDHVERQLDPETLLIADERGPLAIAGVIGGASSEVGDGTTRVVIESAIFDPVMIRRTARRLALRSEASSRFEKGQEFRLARIGADRTARLIAEWAGGTVARSQIDTNPDEPEAARVAFRPARVNRLLGTDLAPAEQGQLLGRVGIEVADTGEIEEETVPVARGPMPLDVSGEPAVTLVATIPTWRRDIEIEADIAEEVARVHGYERIPPVRPHTPMPPWRPDPLELRDVVRGTMAGAGLSEVVTHALVSPRMAETFRWETPTPAVEGGTLEDGRLIAVTNPLSVDHSVLRQSLLGSLLAVVSSNQRHGHPDVAVFEIGGGYGEAADRTVEWRRVGIALVGAAEIPAWNRPTRPYDLDDAKGLIELVAHRLGFDPPQYEPLRGEPLLHPGRAALVTARSDGRIVLGGRVGEVHPDVAASWDVEGRVIAAELDVAGLAGGRPSVPLAAVPPRHQPLERDLAVVVDESTSAAAVRSAIVRAGSEYLADAVLFDIYRGAPLGPGEKSLAFRMAFQAPDRALDEAEVDAAMAAITNALTEEVGGRIRT